MKPKLCPSLIKAKLFRNLAYNFKLCSRVDTGAMYHRRHPGKWAKEYQYLFFPKVSDWRRKCVYGRWEQILRKFVAYRVTFQVYSYSMPKWQVIAKMDIDSKCFGHYLGIAALDRILGRILMKFKITSKKPTIKRGTYLKQQKNRKR